MRKDLTELVFILDGSGSMSHLTDDTIGGFNAMIEEQRKSGGECIVSLVVFNYLPEVVFDRVPIKEIPMLTSKEYRPSGATALVDALGGAIHHIGNVHKYTKDYNRPEKTIFVITTDGYENASCRYSSDRVKYMISRQKERYGWEFLFLGANIDAVETAGRYGIGEDRSVRFHNDSVGIDLNYKVISETISKYRSCGNIDPLWCDEIREDYEERDFPLSWLEK